jgi:hypothetical protein
MPASPGSILPPVALRTISSLRSSALERSSSKSALASTPTQRSIAFDALLSAQINGLKTVRKADSSRDARRAISSGWVIA